MAGQDDLAGTPRIGTASAPPPNWGRRIFLGLLGLLLFLLVALAGAYLWLGTDSGRAFVARQIEALRFDNGMTIGIGRIEGSIFGAMRVRDLRIGDPRGVFLAAPSVEMDWRPLAYLRSHVDVRSLVIPSARFYRAPQFRETPPSVGPLLPDLDIDVGRLELGRLQIDPPVTGQRHLVGFAGTVHIADRRAQIRARAQAIAAPGLAGGDRMTLVLDAVPDANRLDIDLKGQAPAHGLIASLSGVAQPLDIALAGNGDWRIWNGRLFGTLGSERLANVVINARDGTFTVRGPIRPGLFLTGPGRDMLEPVTEIDMAATTTERRVQLRGGLSSDNFAVGADGLIDLGASRMRDLKLSFRLLKPSVIAENLQGDAITAQATLDGSFAAPSVSYGLNAGRIGFGETMIDGLAVSGSAAFQKDQWRIPVQGSARRISGVNASVEPLLTNLRLNGDLAYANGRLLSDNIHLRSDRIDATAVVIADLNKALYTGAFNGRVNGYQVESVGIFNVQTNMDLKSGADGYFKLGGRVTARSTRLLNDGMASFLGGNALIVADVGYDSNGLATLDRLNVAAPAFRLTGGQGRYAADGSVRFSARGTSDQYGPLGVDVTGTLAQPLIRATAARPGLGVGLADVVATIRGEGGTYRIVANGGTDYGPLAADMVVITDKGPLTIDLHRGTRFSDIGFTGRIAQTDAGPFAGTLRASGAGLNGRVDLSAQSDRQRAVVKATGRNVNLPGRIGFTTDRAIVNADMVMYDQPQLVAEVQLAGTRMGELYIAGARADVNYRRGAGQAKLLVEGRTRYPFRVAANALLDPALWRVALNGRLNGIDVATRAPMQIVPGEGGYTLRPATLTIGTGTLDLAGRYGPGMALRARLNDINLALLNPFAPDLGLGGMANGSLDFNQETAAALPNANARLQVDGFTRTSLAAVSEPVDMTMTARLRPDGGQAGALIRRRGAAIGRMQVNLRPLGEGADWTGRLFAAPLSGGVRYNGPADVLFSLAALPDQSLKGSIGLAADFSGRLETPQLTGVVRATNLTYENAQYGTKLTNMAINGRFTNDRLQVESLTAKAGDGTVSANGFVSLSAAESFPMQLGIEMNNAQLASGQDLSARATGQLNIVNGAGRPPTISGRIGLPETRYRIVYQGATQVATLTGVRRKPPPGRERISGSPEPLQSVPSDWRLDVTVEADNRIYVSGMGLESEWAADLKVGGTSGAPRITGTVTLVRGTLGFAGHSFTLQEGRVAFNGGPMTDPDVNIVARGDIEDVTVNINITGSGMNPQIAITSTPALPEDELMARILFGGPVGELSTVQALQLAASLNSLRGGGGGLNPLGALQSAGGIDRLRILGPDEASGRGPAVAAGQYITNDVYVEIVTDARGFTATQLEVALTKALSVLSQMGSFGGSSVNLRYRKDY